MFVRVHVVIKFMTLFILLYLGGGGGGVALSPTMVMVMSMMMTVMMMIATVYNIHFYTMANSINAMAVTLIFPNSGYINNERERERKRKKQKKEIYRHIYINEYIY